ncbi:uncharacterized protein B0H18DRAFT_1120434 [Fomitopsis serialis]|uniref:uncharacterized protein n=1 Tax=Fomitopsis serialis TaxID=139415 RepID=UPI002007244A|nr:uncharacterized protein B0H18DRAFT_1120434 [Neoantrodia serialis]KAH9923331.1 hypothetical protein B0H18DRAFT_1120434 [Neoantrodia serialis]
MTIDTKQTQDASLSLTFMQPARLPMVLPRTKYAPEFDGKCLQDFLDAFEDAANASRLTDKEKCRRVVQFCTDKVRKVLICRSEFEGSDWEAAKKRMTRTYGTGQQGELGSAAELRAFVEKYRKKKITNLREYYKYVQRFTKHAGNQPIRHAIYPKLKEEMGREPTMIDPATVQQVEDAVEAYFTADHYNREDNSSDSDSSDAESTSSDDDDGKGKSKSKTKGKAGKQDADANLAALLLDKVDKALVENQKMQTALLESQAKQQAVFADTLARMQIGSASASTNATQQGCGVAGGISTLIQQRLDIQAGKGKARDTPPHLAASTHSIELYVDDEPMLGGNVYAVSSEDVYAFSATRSQTRMQGSVKDVEQEKDVPPEALKTMRFDFRHVTDNEDSAPPKVKPPPPVQVQQPAPTQLTKDKTKTAQASDPTPPKVDTEYGLMEHESQEKQCVAS